MLGMGAGTGDTTMYRTAESLPSPGWRWDPGLPLLWQVPFIGSGAVPRPVRAESTSSSPAARVSTPAFNTIEALALVEGRMAYVFKLL